MSPIPVMSPKSRRITPVEWAVNALFFTFETALLARVVLSWIPHNRRHPAADVVYRITDPLVLLCREMIFSLARLLRADVRSVPLDLSAAMAFLFVELILRRVALIIVRVVT